MHRFLILLALLLLPRLVAAQALVAETDPLSPAEEQKKFKLPPGFEIELVAAEPDIHKPMNLEFDAHGRLWVTHSVEYPFAAADDQSARDAVTILSDLGTDGRARKAVRFADHLNIPIGVLPLGDRDTLVWSIPNLYRLSDTTGRGVADQRTVLFGPFGITDVHGNQNAFTRWVDGWIYANHGFSNHSQPKKGGTGDVAIDMQSGNAYRFRADGSTIEQFAWGQVNPFGLCFDPLGNLFTADCHSRAVTMVLREGYYPSFGKPHDGLGFAPETTDVDHGGTGIAGIVYYAADQFPAHFQNSLFVGNVITNRVHCDRLKWNGSSPRVAAVEDFLTCDDPWFRPVDIQLGLDGALYIADFYNRIIGHYEVPLTHPQRDRERGRIWRVVYRGPAAQRHQPAGSPAPADLATLDAQPLIELLGHPNLTVRTLATHTLVDRFGSEAATACAGSCHNLINPLPGPPPLAIRHSTPRRSAPTPFGSSSEPARRTRRSTSRSPGNWRAIRPRSCACIWCKRSAQPRSGKRGTEIWCAADSTTPIRLSAGLPPPRSRFIRPAKTSLHWPGCWWRIAPTTPN